MEESSFIWFGKKISLHWYMMQNSNCLFEKSLSYFLIHVLQFVWAGNVGNVFPSLYTFCWLLFYSNSLQISPWLQFSKSPANQCNSFSVHNLLHWFGLNHRNVISSARMLKCQFSSIQFYSHSTNSHQCCLMSFNI